MIKLHQLAPAFGLPNASPFCMKVETYLRMAGLANLLWAPVDSPIQRCARERPTLEAYCQRMKARYDA